MTLVMGSLKTLENNLPGPVHTDQGQTRANILQISFNAVPPVQTQSLCPLSPGVAAAIKGFYCPQTALCGVPTPTVCTLNVCSYAHWKIIVTFPMAASGTLFTVSPKSSLDLSTPMRAWLLWSSQVPFIMDHLNNCFISQEVT